MNPLSPLRLTLTAHPILYEVNTRALITRLSRRAGKSISLGDLPDELLDDWMALGYDAVWMMGIWETGPTGRRIAKSYPGLQDEFKRALPDLTDDDIGGSPYAVQAYEPARALGGYEGVERLRNRLHERGIALVLDFVCNHTARDHAWVLEHPEYFIQGADHDALQHPDQYFSADTKRGKRNIAFGRDPYFPGWTDTAQLDYHSPETRRAMTDELMRVAELCDGVRCDMAMLILNDVFAKTWPATTHPDRQPEFWSQAIHTVRQRHPAFLFIAEAYWNREWDLQQLGFDYTYDKTLYDRLLREGAGAVRDHLKAEMEYQRHCLRFIENHDETAAAAAMPSESWQFAAAVVAGTIPGMFLLHDGQLDGNPVKLPVQLIRRAEWAPNPRTQSFYRSLLNTICAPVFRTGTWLQMYPRAAWGENHTWTNFLASWWHDDTNGDRFVIVNYAPLSGQCYIDIPVDLLSGTIIEFRDVMGRAVYIRERSGLETKGMFFDLQPYSFHIFSVFSKNR